MESRRGITSHHEAPWFALDPGGHATEHAGKVWFGTLAWSGNWKMTVEYTANRQMRVTGGINDFDFAWELKPGEVFKTPEFIGGYTEEGFGGASRALHRYELRHVYPESRRGKPWPVFYNTWETFWFDFDEEKLMALAEKAAALGVEEFHVDDGWFGTRHNEYSGLGDWYVNRRKFPRGLKSVVEKVKALGMEFSLWIEPENVNLDSDLYRAHPDWVYGFPTRRPSIQRESLILNLGLPGSARVYLAVPSRLWSGVRGQPLQMGLQPPFQRTGLGRAAGGEAKGTVGAAHPGRLRDQGQAEKEFPQVTLECCSGGGGRVDYGVLRYCEMALASDNHDPLARLLIQEGYSYVFPPRPWAAGSPTARRR